MCLNVNHLNRYICGFAASNCCLFVLFIFLTLIYIGKAVKSRCRFIDLIFIHFFIKTKLFLSCDVIGSWTSDVALWHHHYEVSEKRWKPAHAWFPCLVELSDLVECDRAHNGSDDARRALSAEGLCRVTLPQYHISLSHRPFRALFRNVKSLNSETYITFFYQ